MRVKESLPEILGLDTVKQYTGYLDIDSLDKHLFYWFLKVEMIQRMILLFYGSMVVQVAALQRDYF